MLIFQSLALLFIAQISIVAAHGHFDSDHELSLFKRRYAINHRSLINNCGEKVRARKLKRDLSPSSSLHPTRRESLIQELNARDDNSTTTSSTSNTTTSSCVLDGEVTEGPYHVLGELIRQNITEGLLGVPVTFDVDFVDYSTCEPLKNAWIDVWHANSTGFYSGYTTQDIGTGSGGGGGSMNGSTSSIANATAAATAATATTSGSATITVSASMSSGTGSDSSDESFLATLTTDELSFDRGIWKTDEEGHLTMYDTVPGWYSGRAVHTHLKVYDESSGYQAENGTFVANNTAYHTGQWFWPQSFLAQLADLDPYSANTLAYKDSTKNDEDTIYPDAAANGNAAEMTITFIDENDIMAGVIASTVVGVNLTYSSKEIGPSIWNGNVTEALEASGNSTESEDSTTTTASTDGALKSPIVSINYLMFVTIFVAALAHFTLSK